MDSKDTLLHTSKLNLRYRSLSNRRDLKLQLHALSGKAREYEQRARFDDITELRRREELVDFLKEKVGDEQAVMLFIDIDHFKEVNDKYTHERGNTLLKILGQRLKSNFPESRGDFVCRYGGEEFVVILNNHSINLQAAIKRAEEFRKLIEVNPFKLDDLVVVSKTISIGVSLRDQGLSIDEWIKQSDIAMYTAKHQGRNMVVVWQEGMQMPKN